jgi:subtilisin family serine protease
VDVAVLDSGIAAAHPDLNLVGGVACGPNKTSVDGAGHGTHVAGIIGARDNGFGVVGVAPGARLWAVKVLTDKGIGSWGSVICGIDWVTANASTIEVANMSLGGKGSDDGDCGRTKHDPVHEAICASVAAGVTYVVGAGNGSEDAATFIPAAYDEVLTVSALTDYDGKPGGLAQPTCFNLGADDSLATYSNFGADIDLIAPGSCIFSTWAPDSYQNLTGTSMAGPHVTGGAALYAATHPGAGPAQVRAALLAQGTTDWNASTDPDGIKEPQLNVAGF